jgi:hypothetical protein
LSSCLSQKELRANSHKIIAFSRRYSHGVSLSTPFWKSVFFPLKILGTKRQKKLFLCFSVADSLIVTANAQQRLVV